MAGSPRGWSPQARQRFGFRRLPTDVRGTVRRMSERRPIAERCLRQQGQFPLPASRVMERPASLGRIMGLSGEQREYRAAVRVSAATERNSGGPSAAGPADGLRTVFFAHRSRQYGPLQWCRPSIRLRRGPEGGVPSGDVRTSAREPLSSTGDSSGCGWPADVRTVMAVPSTCSRPIPPFPSRIVLSRVRACVRPVLKGGSMWISSDDLYGNRGKTSGLPPSCHGS